jgi:hypothetical protein
VEVLLDADGLIKLNRAGVLSSVIEAFTCIVPSTVYHEVVTTGKARLHKDAEIIEEIIGNKVSIEPSRGGDAAGMGLGQGELAILNLLPEMPDAIVVSDDRRFLSVLADQAIRFLTPADVLVVLVHQGALTREAAEDALERLRPVIRTQAYWDARQDLAAKGESDGKE